MAGIKTIYWKFIIIGIFSVQVKQPMFGANYIKGDVISEPDGESPKRNGFVCLFVCLFVYIAAILQKS